MSTKPERFAEFWPLYLRAHGHATSRLLHYIGTLGSLVCIALLIMTGSWWWAIVGAAFAYSMAWFGHFFVENNVPLAFSRPLWSLAADYRMFALMLVGRLDRHLRAAQTGSAGA